VRIAPAFLRRIVDNESIVDNEPCASDRVELLDNFGSRDLEVERMAKRLLTEFRERRYATRTYADAIATELGVHLLRNYCAPMGAVLRSARVLPVHKLRRVAEFVEDNLPDDLTHGSLDAPALSRSKRRERHARPSAATPGLDLRRPGFIIRIPHMHTVSACRPARALPSFLPSWPSPR
jgi:hypothetical protein